VKLGGKGFTLLTEQGAQVKAGDPLIRFDRQVIADAGYKDTVIMAVTNSAEYPQLQKATGESAKAGETPVLIF
jgi:PTS system arbutin-like IIC component